MRIHVDGPPFPHPEDPERMVAPHEARVRMGAGGKVHPRVLAVDTEAHTVRVHVADAQGRLIKRKGADGKSRTVEHVLNVAGKGWLLELPGDPPGTQRVV